MFDSVEAPAVTPPTASQEPRRCQGHGKVVTEMRMKPKILNEM